MLEHRWFLSEAAGHDVGMERAATSYVQGVLAFAQDERSVLLERPAPADESPPSEPGRGRA
jgi:hypothetical protein